MEDQFFMARAIELSRNGLGRTYPNPIVGAVIVSTTGEIIGEGFHTGGDHAEVVALKDCASRGHSTLRSTMYVSLEPCNHVGKTPACTEAIRAAGIDRVVFAVHDPNPIAKGGAEYLRSLGVQVVANILERESAIENRAWLHKVGMLRPHITWKIASTFDGYTAALDGTSKWITSIESRSLVQKLRAESDAILVGTGTALADNPALVPQNDERRPLRIVMGMRKLPSNSKVLDEKSQTLIIPSRNLEDLIDRARDIGLNSILVEAGPTLGTALLNASLVDEIHWFQAPVLLGSGKKAIGDLHVRTLAERRDFAISGSEKIGSDIYTTLIPKSKVGI